jgi:1-deoxy-D-xylulose-5-phosphate synthase
VKPLDTEAYKALIAAHKTVITLEDNVLPGGFGAGLGELILDAGLNTRLLRYGLPDGFVEHGEIPQLLKELGIDGESLAEKILKQLEGQA